MTELTIHDPSAAADEVELLRFALERARAQFAWKCGGLDAAALNKPHPSTTMTLGGLLKHVAGCEARIVALHLTGEPPEPPWDAIDHDTDRDWEWRTAVEDTPEELDTLYRDALAYSKAAWARALAEGGLDQPSKYVWPNGERPHLRRILIDTIEHNIRHAGHADLLREAVDGLVGEDPPQP